jgi:hypothetical protein
MLHAAIVFRLIQENQHQSTIFCHLIGVAYPSAFTPCNIQSGFRVCGLWPANADIFRDDEYLSSYVTDRPEAIDQ